MLENIWEFIREYGTDLWAIWGAFLTIVIVVVKITPNKRDDKIVDVALKILSALGLNPKDDKTEKERKKDELEEEINERDDDRTRRDLTDALR